MSQFSGQVNRIPLLFNNGSHSSGGQNLQANEQIQNVLTQYRNEGSTSSSKSMKIQPSSVNRIHQLLNNRNQISESQNHKANEQLENVLTQYRNEGSTSSYKSMPIQPSSVNRLLLLGKKSSEGQNHQANEEHRNASNQNPNNGHHHDSRQLSDSREPNPDNQHRAEELSQEEKELLKEKMEFKSWVEQKGYNKELKEKFPYLPDPCSNSKMHEDLEQYRREFTWKVQEEWNDFKNSKLAKQNVGLWVPGKRPYNFESYTNFCKDIVVKIDQVMQSECTKEKLIRLVALYDDPVVKRMVSNYNPCDDQEFESLCADARTAAYNFEILRGSIFFDKVVHIIRSILDKEMDPQHKVKKIGTILIYAETGDKMGDHDVVLLKEVKNTLYTQWYNASEKVNRLSSLFQDFKLRYNTDDFRRARKAGSRALKIVEDREDETYFEKEVLKNTRNFTVSDKPDKTKIGEIFSYLRAASLIKI